MTNEATQPNDLEPAWITSTRIELMVKLALRVAQKEIDKANVASTAKKPMTVREHRAKRKMSRVSHL